MSPLAQFDQKLEKIIREFTLRIMVPSWSEFEGVWEATNRICDRYELAKAPDQVSCQPPESVRAAAKTG